VCDIFSDFQVFITEDQDIRENLRVVVRDLEQKSREIYTLLQAVHQHDGLNACNKLCTECRLKFTEVRHCYDQLAAKVPNNQYYRFSDHWRTVTQRLCFLAAFVVYLETEQLIGRQDTTELLGVKLSRDEGFHMDIEDYLMGLLQLANELSRLSVNAVTSGDYSRPVRIARFIADLDSGFRLLNLKNDTLRKRYDGLKYDLKKAEEVVYDLTIRGLVTHPSLSPPSTSVAPDTENATNCVSSDNQS
jgi:predicted translin family RNA/ssDNA-binding protein